MTLRHLLIKETPEVAELKAANEAEVGDGKPKKELEYVWYGRVLDFSIIEKAIGFEIQRQSAIKQPGGLIRVRKTVKDGQVSYVETTKLFSADGSRQELPYDCDALKHEFFMKMTGGSTDKTRYFYPAGGGLTWEVDFYTDLEGNFKPWCKIDLEVKEPLLHVPTPPVKMADVIFLDPTKGRPSEEVYARTSDLNNRLFVNKIA